MRTRHGAATRQPLCEWPQYKCDNAAAARVPKSLDVFLEAYGDSAALARKTNFHIPKLDNTAGY